MEDLGGYSGLRECSEEICRGGKKIIIHSEINLTKVEL